MSSSGRVKIENNSSARRISYTFGLTNEVKSSIIVVSEKIARGILPGEVVETAYNKKIKVIVFVVIGNSDTVVIRN